MIKLFIMILIKLYQWFVSPFLGKNCRFEPTCSHYAVQCLKEKSLLNALKLILNRLKKCHPWGKFGIDPVSH